MGGSHIKPESRRSWQQSLRMMPVSGWGWGHRGRRMRSWRDARLAKCLPYKHYHERLNPKPRLPFLSWVWWQAGEDNAMASEQKVEGTGMLFHQVTPELLASLVCFLPSHVSLCCDRRNLKEQGSWFKRKRIHYGAKAWQSLKVVGVRPGPGTEQRTFHLTFSFFSPWENAAHI